MSIINFGSLNIDHVYQVNDFVMPGETLSSEQYQIFVGGKGLNQSIALAKAGAEVKHVGAVGQEAQLLIDTLAQNQVDTHWIESSDTPTGHAMIQVSASGENAIVLFAGANHTLTDARIEDILSNANQNDWVLCQNETNCIDVILTKAKQKNLTVCFNPAPMTPAVKDYPLDCVDYLFVNETEGAQLTGKNNVDDILQKLKATYPNTKIILTLGEQGVIYQDAEQQFKIPAKQVKAIDTTAAGDTFIGYFIAGLTKDLGIKASLELATKASAFCVTQKGASVSIPVSKNVSSECGH